MADDVLQNRGWARTVSWATLGCVLPSAVWRSAVGLGVDLGWSDHQLARQAIPGNGTIYVLLLSVASVGLASLSFRLSSADGDRVPAVVPLLGRRRVPWRVVVGLSSLGLVGLAYVVARSIADWNSVSGFADQPGSRWELVMIACYAPVVAWPMLLLVVTVDYVRRRGRRD